MKKLYVLFFMFLAGCVSSDIGQEIMGTWKWDDRVLTISKNKIVFNHVKSDFIEYSISHDSTVLFTVEVGEGWGGKILDLQSDKIIYYDSLLQKQIVLYKLAE